MESIASRRKQLFDLIVANEAYGIQRRAEPIVKFELGEERPPTPGFAIFPAGSTALIRTGSRCARSRISPPRRSR